MKKGRGSVFGWFIVTVVLVISGIRVVYTSDLNGPLMIPFLLITLAAAYGIITGWVKIFRERRKKD